ncbi:MAG TPA: hypothetical protein PK529_05510, partial [Verrucomicrobiales bacterium]|nr:hypothetical protein [Verrucomicrobiales bacterium]
MMLLDTNVLSELRKASRCDPAVAAWQQTQALDRQFVSVISLLELKLGIELEPRKNVESTTRLKLKVESNLRSRTVFCRWTLLLPKPAPTFTRS